MSYHLFDIRLAVASNGMATNGYQENFGTMDLLIAMVYVPNNIKNLSKISLRSIPVGVAPYGVVNTL